MANKITYNGIDYPSVTSLAKEYSILPNTLKYRLEQGMSVKDALSTRRKSRVDKNKPTPSNVVKIEYNGKHYDSFTQLCKEYNVPLANFSKRKSRGYSIEECIYGRRDIKVNYTYNNKGYYSLMEIAKEYNISLSTLSGRLSSGYSLKDAIEGNIETSIEYEGILYKNEKELCKKQGVSYATFRSRKNRGASLEECLYKGYLKLNRSKKSQ